MRKQAQWLQGAGLIIAMMVGIMMPSAVAASPFTVEAVAIDATATSAAQAQGKAQNEGFRLAYQALLDKLVLQTDQARVPTPTDDQLSGMIKSFQVGEEKRSSTRYLAELTVRFKPDQVRYWLRNAGVSISETAAEPTLLLPVWVPRGQEPQLWGQLNPWRQVFENSDKRPGAVIPFTLPDGDLEDLQTLTARQAVSLNADALITMTERYGMDRYVVLAIRLTESEAVIAYSINDPFGPRRWNSRFNRQPDLEAAEELAALREAALLELDEDWKRRTQIGALTNATMSVTVPVPSLKAWQDIQARLNATAGVREVVVRELTLDQALVQIAYQGRLEQLQVGLEAQSLQLMADYDGRAVLYDLKAQDRAKQR